MADEGEDAGAPGQITNIEDLHGCLQEILHYCDIKGRGDIVEQIVNEIDVDLIVQARECVFKVATAVFRERIGNDNNNIVLDLQLKTRKGTNAITSYAKDVFDLYVYIQDSTVTFPKDLLRNGDILLDIGLNVSDATLHTEDIANNDNDALFNAVSDDTIKEILITLNNVCREQGKKITTLEAKLLREQQTRQLEMKTYVEQFHVLINELERQGYVAVEHNEDMVSVVFEQGRNPKQRENNGVPIVHPAGVAQNTTNGQPKERTRRDQAEPTRGATGTSTNVTTASNDADSAGVEDARVHRVSVSSASSDSSDSGDSSPDSPGCPVDAPPPAPREKPTFTAVVRDGQWQDPPHVKRRQQKADNKNRAKPRQALRGAYSGNTTTLYVENIEIDYEQKREEIMQEVRNYIVGENNIKLLDTFIIFNKFRKDRCGAKITIPTKDIDSPLASDFWPRGISCRVWEDRRQKQTRSDGRSFKPRHQNSDEREPQYDNDCYGRDAEYDYERRY